MHELRMFRELFVMKMNDDAKLEEEWTFRFKTDMRNLTSFESNTQESQKLAL